MTKFISINEDISSPLMTKINSTNEDISCLLANSIQTNQIIGAIPP